MKACCHCGWHRASAYFSYFGKRALFIKEIVEKCQQQGIRVKLDLRDVKLSQKIHDVRRERVPYTVIVGEQEAKRKQLTVQSVKRPDIHPSGVYESEVFELDEFIALILKEAKSPILK